MKKMMTLLVAVIAVTAASAQYRADNDRDFGYDKGRDNNGWNKNGDNRYGNYSFSTRERDMQIAQINKKYDRQIREVRNKLFASRFRKDQMIAGLEQQRREEVRRIYARFNDRDNRDRDYNIRRF